MSIANAILFAPLAFGEASNIAMYSAIKRNLTNKINDNTAYHFSDGTFLVVDNNRQYVESFTKPVDNVCHRDFFRQYRSLIAS